MAANPISLPLRDRIRHAEKQVNELMQHLDQSYLKEVRNLQRVTEKDAPPVGDMTIRMGVAKVLQADEETEQLWKSARLTLKSIQAEFERIANEGGT